MAQSTFRLEFVQSSAGALRLVKFEPDANGFWAISDIREGPVIYLVKELLKEIDDTKQLVIRRKPKAKAK